MIPMNKDEENLDHYQSVKISNFIRTFAFIWCFTIWFLNLTLLFSSVFWAASLDIPSNFDLLILVSVEIIIIIDFILKIIISNIIFVPKHVKKIFNLQNSKSKIKFIFQVMTSIPLVTFVFLSQIENKDIYFYIFLIKLLKVYDINAFINRFEDILLNSSFFHLVGFKLFENIIIMISFTHFSSCSWLLVNKIWPEFQGKEGFFKRKKRENLPLIDTYLDSSVWAVSAMTGASYGDVTPNTIIEIILAVFMMILGASFYGKVFADFEKIIQINLSEKLEKS